MTAMSESRNETMDLKTVLSNCDAKRDHNYRLGADNFTITTAEYHALRECALRSLVSETAPFGYWDAEDKQLFPTVKAAELWGVLESELIPLYRANRTETGDKA